jgi:hypothetical protein
MMAMWWTYVLGIRWLRKAIPNYQGAVSFRVQLDGIKGKYLRGSVDERGRYGLQHEAPVWTGACIMRNPQDHLDQLKTLYYRFVRSGQQPGLQTEGDRFFDSLEQAPS